MPSRFQTKSNFKIKIENNFFNLKPVLKSRNQIHHFKILCAVCKTLSEDTKRENVYLPLYDFLHFVSDQDISILHGCKIILCRSLKIEKYQKQVMIFNIKQLL